MMVSDSDDVQAIGIDQVVDVIRKANQTDPTDTTRMHDLCRLWKIADELKSITQGPHESHRKPW